MLHELYTCQNWVQSSDLYWLSFSEKSLPLQVLSYFFPLLDWMVTICEPHRYRTAPLYCHHYHTAFSEVIQNGVAACNRDVTSVRWLETVCDDGINLCLLRFSREERLLLFMFGTADGALSSLNTFLICFPNSFLEFDLLLLDLMTKNIQIQSFTLFFIWHVLFLTRWSGFFLGFSHFLTNHNINRINVSDAWWPQQHKRDLNSG